MVGDAAWKVLLVVSHHDESLVLTGTESVDDFLHFLSALAVKTVKRFIEDEEFWVFHEGTCEEYHALLSA